MKNIILGLATASLCALAPTSVFAGPYEDAVYAHNDEDYAQALSLFQKLSSENHADAQFYLGHMTQRGEGVKSSKKKAAKLFMKAAEQGNNNARVALGSMYWVGSGVRQSDQKAFELFKLASENDHQTGRYYLGRIYDGGFGVKASKQTAFNLYSQIQRMGGYPAEITSDSYKNHLWDVNRWDPVNRWYNYEQKGMKETFTPESAAAKKTYEDIKRQYIEGFDQSIRDELDAAFAAAGPIENGWSAYRAKDYKRAFPILLAHANDGNVEAQTRVGVMYRDGLGVTPSDNTAGKWFEKAETGGSGEAFYHHAMLSFWGRYSGGHLLPEQLMKQSYRLGYQPAIDRNNRKQAEKDRIARLQQERLQKEAEAAARRAEHLRKNPPRTITNCDGPRPGDAPPVPTGYSCDRRSGSPTYGGYVRKD